MEYTKIDWCDYTWNPIRGCSKVGAGCDNCYALEYGNRFCAQGLNHHGFVEDGKWTGRVELLEHKLDELAAIKKPSKIFVNSMSDLFHKNLSHFDRAMVLSVIYKYPQHDFMVLTKRPQIALEFHQWLKDEYEKALQFEAQPYIKGKDGSDTFKHILEAFKRLWLGVSIWDQASTDEFIPLLLQIPAAVRFVSAEPLLGAIDLGLNIATCDCCERYDSRWIQLDRNVGGDWPIGHETIANAGIYRAHSNPHGALSVITGNGKLLGIKPAEMTVLSSLDWVIVGGENGANARPMNPKQARSIRDQCRVAGTEFFFKGWGKYEPFNGANQRGDCDLERDVYGYFDDDGNFIKQVARADGVIRVGGKGGNVMDDMIHQAFPSELTTQRSKGVSNG